MKPEKEQSLEREMQGKVARRYRRLGYDVQENPSPDLLPDFMHGVQPDLVARSRADNVVVEIKRHRALKGSNDLVGIAERVSDHSDWRFELVVLEDENSSLALSDATYERVLEAVQAATDNRLFGMACVYLANVIVRTIRDLARRNNVRASSKADVSLVLELGFKGVLPDDMIDECLSALSLRESLYYMLGGTHGPSADTVQGLVRLCGLLRALL